MCARVCECVRAYVHGLSLSVIVHNLCVCVYVCLPVLVHLSVRACALCVRMCEHDCTKTD